MGFNKIHYVLDLFEQHPDIEWLLFSECDATVTNLTTRIEDKIDNDYHFIVPVDRLNINSGNFLARNSEEGRAYLQMIIDLEESYKDVEWAEQQVIIDTAEANKDIIKFLPQKDINAYDYGLYPECVPKDKFDNDGQWSKGDLLIHWPGTSLWQRIDLAKKYMEQIVE